MSSNTITLNPFFSPTQISGCQLWFDGNDPAGNGSIPANASSITTWVDKSGRGKNLSGGSGANTFSTYGNRNSVLFNSDRLQNISAAVNVNTLTVFIAWLQKEPRSNSCLFFLTDGNAYNSKGVGIYSDSTSTRPGGTSIVRVYPAAIGSEANANLPVATSSDVSPFNINSIAIDSTSSIEIFVNGTSGATKTNAVSRNVTANNAVAGSEIANSNSATSIANVSEILVYNVTLSSSQRQLVEGYLAWKWNAVNLLPSNHPYKNTPVYTINTIPRSLQSSIPSSISASSSPFSFFYPTQISGCTMWLDPTDLTTFTFSGTNITQWRDKSSTGAVFTGYNNPTLSSTTYGGCAPISFNGSAYLQNTNFVFTTTSRTSFFVYDEIIEQNNVGVLSFASSGTDSNQLDAMVYETGNKSSQYLMLAQSSQNTGYYLAIQTTTIGFALYSDTFGSGTETAYVNGSQTATTTSAAAFTNSTGLIIGARMVSGSVSLSLNGVIGEIILYNRPLSTSERQQVEGYLAWKWGLVASLPTNQPYKNAPPGLTIPVVPLTRVMWSRTWSPLNISVCSIWLDAADSSTITATGTAISQWREKALSRIYSGSATIATTDSYPSVSFNGSQTMTTTTTLSLSEVSVNSANFTCFLVIFVSSSTAVNSSPFHVGLNSSRFMPFYNSTGGLFFDGALQSNPRLSGCTFTNNVRQIHVFNRNATVNMQFRLNGSLNNSGTFATPANFGNEAYTAYLSASGVQVTGALQEAIYYSSDLGTSNIQVVEGYLAWKWGLVSSLPANHPYKKWPPPPS